MADKKNRRSFLKGAALVGATAALPLAASPPSALAQGRGIPLAPPPPNDNMPEDKADELAPLVQAAVSEAMSRADKVLENLIRSPAPKPLRVGTSLSAQGLQLRSPGAQRHANTTITNLELIKKKAQEGKATGWHAHVCWVSIPVVGCIVHSHASW